MPKIIDFGVAKATRRAAHREDAAHAVRAVDRHAGVHEPRAGGVIGHRRGHARGHLFTGRGALRGARRGSCPSPAPSCSAWAGRSWPGASARPTPRHRASGWPPPPRRSRAIARRRSSERSLLRREIAGDLDAMATKAVERDSAAAVTPRPPSCRPTWGDTSSGSRCSPAGPGWAPGFRGMSAGTAPASPATAGLLLVVLQLGFSASLAVQLRRATRTAGDLHPLVASARSNEEAQQKEHSTRLLTHRTHQTLVVPLGSRRCTAPDVVGWKAARLARLVEEASRNQAPFRVPPGVVVTAAALLEHCARNRIRTDAAPAAVAAAIRAGTLAPPLTAALELAGRHLGGGPFAVRSSAVAEDRADGSMAGLLETYLGVATADLASRLRDCWASLYSPRAQSYLHRSGGSARSTELRMGVLVQRQLAPRWAGVLFTVDPSRRAGDTMVLEWVEGLGEALVWGSVTPARLLLSRRSPLVPGATPPPCPRPSLEGPARPGPARRTTVWRATRPRVVRGRRRAAPPAGAPGHRIRRSWDERLVERQRGRELSRRAAAPSPGPWSTGSGAGTSSPWRSDCGCPSRAAPRSGRCSTTCSASTAGGCTQPLELVPDVRTASRRTELAPVLRSLHRPAGALRRTGEKPTSLPCRRGGWSRR